AVAAGLGVSAPTPASAARLETLTGWFHIVWTVPAQRGQPAQVNYLLVDDAGRATELLLDAGFAARYGVPESLDRQQVTVIVSPLEASGRALPGQAGAGASTSARGIPVARLQSLTLTRPSARPIAPPGEARAPFGAAQSGAKSYVTILCRFADSATVTPRAKSEYETWMGGAYPGLDHYWQEQSGNRVNLNGTLVVGWYDLPQPRAYYFPNGTNKDPDWGLMANDCTAAADADVVFPQYFGINMQFNLHMFASWGGGWTLTRDGETRPYGVTWMANWATLATYGHETGHSLGLPHSSGPYSATYDSRWDVMSGGGFNEPLVGTAVGTHTIAYHKDLLGWIPPGRKYVPTLPSRRAIRIERSALPGESGDYLMAQIPLPGAPGQFYTVESRRFAGYDGKLPGEAIIIHTVNPARSDRDAQVVDPDGNGNPNDAGAMWKPGETFADSLNGFTLAVDAATQTGYDVTVTYGWQLTVAVAGAGRVTAAATPAIDCPGACSTLFGTRGATVTLTASPNASTFTGWSDPACPGTGPCTVAMTANRDITATFGAIAPVVIASDSARRYGVVGAPYADALAATGGAGAVGWALTGGALPAGVTLDAATGVVSGTPAAPGDFAYRVSATSGTTSASKMLGFTVHRPLAISSDPVRKAAMMGASYADTLVATGGPHAATWAVSSGALPEGLALDGGTGVVSGVPAAAGSFSFTVTSTSDTLRMAKTLALTVTKPVLSASAVMDRLLGASAATLTADELRFLDLQGNRNGRLDVGDVRAWLRAGGGSAKVARAEERP
ncbi:MAG: putative Ig domain-containing protein, partial [Gemmatimonadaceae bacterium]